MTSKCRIFPSRHPIICLHLFCVSNGLYSFLPICLYIVVKDMSVRGLVLRGCLVCLHKGPSINDGGRGPPSQPIYYISLFSNLSRQGEGGPGGLRFGKLGQRCLWMTPNLYFKILSCIPWLTDRKVKFWLACASPADLRPVKNRNWVSWLRWSQVIINYFYWRIESHLELYLVILGYTWSFEVIKIMRQQNDLLHFRE